MNKAALQLTALLQAEDSFGLVLSYLPLKFMSAYELGLSIFTAVRYRGRGAENVRGSAEEATTLFLEGQRVP